MKKPHKLDLSVVIEPGNSLSPLTEDKVKVACFDLLIYLRELALSSFGESSPLLTVSSERVLTQVCSEDYRWNATPEQSHFVDTSLLWRKFYCLFKYAEFGEGDVSQLITEESLLETIYQLNTAMSYIDELGLYGEHESHELVTVVCKALARFKLDNDSSLSEDHDIYCLSFFPYTHDQHLSLFEVALLANVKTLKSVRNATYSKLDPLITIKEGNNKLVTVEEAKIWLANRPKFVATK